MPDSTTMVTAESATAAEIATQPDLWRRVPGWRPQDAVAILGSGRALVLGCGTSAFVAEIIASLREDAGHGETDWCYASEVPAGRHYDHVLAISRSATTSEVLQALGDMPRGGTRTAVVAVDGEISRPIAALVNRLVVLAEADELSVVQTRFPTSLIAFVRTALGHAPDDLAEQGERALALVLPDVSRFDHFVFLGRGWTTGLANEAALKVREMAQAWSESYPAMDYRHGPIAVAGSSTLVMSFGPMQPCWRPTSTRWRS
jgi:fructoselysine-6-P-deglycase FrlB-like protein